MAADENTDTAHQAPGELTPEQAREKREYHLALYRKYAETDRKAGTDQVDAADSTMATFILPGD